MKIALIGYGKMGKTIERLALEKGHEIVYKADVSSLALIQNGALAQADVAIEFTAPEAAPENIMACMDAGIPVVSGTTGWLKAHWPKVAAHCEAKQGSFFYASNYSIGVNIFFEVNARLAQLMNSQPQYKVEIEEIHHTQKLDAPSGTAISLADSIIEYIERFEDWQLSGGLHNIFKEKDAAKFPIIAKRIDSVPGTHIVRYQSAIDEIEISHVAKSREGFAAGAILAAEWLVGKQGIYGMKDLLKF